tara:strand:- start:56 stop:448 length:393 start_codon:yes stop_codon:yes gene_type:complete
MIPRSVDLSDFSVSISYMDELVRYFDETDNQDKEARECEITWKHNTLDVSTLKFYLRENHEAWDSYIAGRQIEILTEWFKELGHDPLYYSLDRDTKTFNLTGAVETKEKADEWLKPNPEGKLKATKPEII